MNLGGVRIISDFVLEDGATSERRFFSSPTSVLVATTLDEVVPVLQRVETATKGGQWAIGYVAYEASPAFDSAMRVHESESDLPLVWFALFASPSEQNPFSGETDDGLSLSFVSDMSFAQWEGAVARVHEAIARGETYQVNLTRRLKARGTSATSLRGLYERLRQAQTGARYTALIDTGEFHIVTVSPELFFSIQGERISTRPMKGTSRRGRWLEEDDRFASALVASEKERAENVMIVDLLRNDLGRISVTGSVRVDDLFSVERYPTVLQMTSKISAQIKPTLGLTDIFGALFPCGSVTGAPKIQTMGHIASLETSRRGVYCGSVGVVMPRGDAVFNVAIRTVTAMNDAFKFDYGVGGGITWDSNAKTEWMETEAKGSVLAVESRPFDLFETLRLEQGHYILLNRHLKRLQDSSLYFKRRFDREAVVVALEDFSSLHSGVWRVRLVLGQTGDVTVEGAPLDVEWGDKDGVSPPRMVQLASSPISRGEISLYHKTTDRRVYERERIGISGDIYDILLWNERDEVTEFTIGNLVAELDGALWTPPRGCGLLNGTFREELLEVGTIQERIISKGDLVRARRLWLINSVRGWVPVVLKNLTL